MGEGRLRNVPAPTHQRPTGDRWQEDRTVTLGKQKIPCAAGSDPLDMITRNRIRTSGKSAWPPQGQLPAGSLRAVSPEGLLERLRREGCLPNRS